MKLLLDTRVFLWWRANDAALGSSARDTIAAAEVVVISAASAWEVAIKVASGRLRVDADFEDGVTASGFGTLPITFSHAREAGRLPSLHRDPFDRMLVAQARLEGLELMTRDRRLARYAVPICWA